MAIRRGLWRLTFVLWVLGSLALLVLPAEPIFSPNENVCVDRPGPPYPECYSEEARELERLIADSDDPVDEALAMVNENYRKIDTSTVVERYETERYHSAIRFLAGLEAAWLAFVWGAFYLVVWIASGLHQQIP